MNTLLAFFEWLVKFPDNIPVPVSIKLPIVGCLFFALLFLVDIPYVFLDLVITPVVGLWFGSLTGFMATSRNFAREIHEAIHFTLKVPVTPQGVKFKCDLIEKILDEEVLSMYCTYYGRRRQDVAKQLMEIMNSWTR